MTTTARLGVDIVAADKSRAAFDAFSRSLRQAQAEQRRFGVVANEAFMSFGRGLRSAAATMGVTFGVGALAGFAKSAITDLAAIKDQAERAGLAISDMQSLTFVARQGGGDQGDVVTLFQKMNKALGEAKRGQGELGKILEANNIAMADGNGKARDNKDIFLDIVDLVKNAGDEIDRDRIMLAAFGRSAQDALPYLKDGADAIRQQEQAARDVGAVIDEEIVRKAAVFDDQWTAVWDGWLATAKAAIVDVAGQLESLSKWKFYGPGTIFDITVGGKSIFETDEKAAATEALTAAQEKLNRALAAGAPEIEIDELKARVQNYREEIERLQATVQSVNRDGKGNFGGLPTKLPSEADKPGKPGTSRTESTRAIEDERDAAAELIERLEYERRLISMTDAERAVATNLRAAGADATAAQTAEIERLTIAMTAEEEAQKKIAAAAESAKEFGQSISMALQDGAMSLVTGASNLKGAVNGVLQELQRLALSRVFQLLFNEGGAFGSGGLGGIFSSIIGGVFGNASPVPSFAGFYAGGGSIPAGKWGIAGEAGPEIVRGPGSVFPMDRGGGGAVNVQIIDQRRNAPAIERQSGPNGSERFIIRDSVREVIGSGAADQQLSQRTGGSPARVRRG